MSKDDEKIAIFGAGCFWCIQKVFDQTKGVENTVVGYVGGDIPFPTYKDVCSGRSGHVEAIKVIFDPQLVTYEKLLEIFWKNIDPTTSNQQFCDIGPQYKSAIFYMNETQKLLAEVSKNEKSKTVKVYTEILKATEFYPAEEYHQKYYLKNKKEYENYYAHSGRLDKLYFSE